MPAPTLPASLQPLVEYLDGLEARASIERTRALLERGGVTLDDVREWIVFGEANYRRNLVTLGRWYELLVICWKSGQRSPIQDLAASTCGLKVLAGVCSETVFDRSPCGQMVARSTRELHAGQVCASQDADTHQVSNLQPPGHDLVTLHLYSPPLRAMKQFSITGAASERRPQVWEFTGGDGI